MKHYKIYMLFFLILSIYSLSFLKVSGEEIPLIGKTIYIDPGHGGMDPGAIYKDLRESDINLSISKVLTGKLEMLGANVYLTRTGDYDLSVGNNYSRKKSDLSNRVVLINNSKCDLYLSIHLNSDISPTWSGAQVFYDNVNSENEVIAKALQSNLKSDLKTDRKIKKISNIYLNHNVTRPGVLVEVGFISNPSERYLLNKASYQEKISDSLVRGIIEYFDK